LNAMYAATIESGMSWDSVGPALGADGDDQMLTYMANRADWHKGSHVRYNGVKIPHLYPGEKLMLNTPQHPKAEFASFEEATLRYLAGGMNMTYEQFSRDYSKTNYSSARAAMLESWRFFKSRRHHIAGRFARLVYALWLEEAIDNGTVRIPAGAPNFYQAKTAWTRCNWIGPGRGHIDPLKEANATKVELQMNLTTLEKEAAERGEDWEEILEQIAEEKVRMGELGLDYASVTGPTPVPQPTDVTLTG
jgi:lambda family phage portal protein